MAAVEVRIVAGREFERTRVALSKAAQQFRRRVAESARAAVDEYYRPALVAAVPTFMPGGYAAVLAPDLVVKTSVRFTGAAAGVRATVTAPTGGPKGRDVLALESSRLRHPLFGNKKYWYQQRIKRGFASMPLKAVRPKIVSRIDSELDKIAEEIKRS